MEVARPLSDRGHRGQPPVRGLGGGGGGAGGEGCKQQPGTSADTDHSHYYCLVAGELQTAIRTGYTCEGEELFIQCEEEETIQIIRANYGRFSIAICNEEGKTHWSVNCMSPKTRHILQNR